MASKLRGPAGYLPRVVDAQLERMLRTAPAVVVEGPRACGKTWTGRRFTTSEVRFDELDATRLRLEIEPASFLAGATPRLLDEWHLAGGLWNAMRHARDAAFDVVVVDTAGRLQIDPGLMRELAAITRVANPDEVLLVVDALTGQEAVAVARGFLLHTRLTGVLLSKLDSDARGGAAISVREATGCPIKLVGTGERPDDLEVFHPERMASRILGMGDVETLIDKAESAFEAEQATETASKLLEGTFTFDDFLATMQQVLGMGSLRSLLGMMPGVPRELRGAEVDEGRIGRITGMIHSMTPQERAEPDIIDASRRRRIAAGSGCRPSDVKALVDQFKQMRSMMKGLGGLGGKRTAASKARSSRQAGRPGGKSSASKRRGAGGRTTPKGPVPVSKAPLTLPGLEKGEWPGLN